MSFQQSFKAMSHPVRREILNILKHGDVTASDIAAHFDLTNATISHHLSILKNSDLISEQKYKNFIYYRINTSVVEEMMFYLSQFTGGKDNEEDKS